MIENDVRDAKGRFAVGTSGNPGGRKKPPAEIMEAFEAATPKAVAVLVSLLDSDDDKIRVKAAEHILNRSLGKPHQSATLTVNDTAATAHLQALQSLVARVMPQPVTIDQTALTDVVDVDLLPLPEVPAPFPKKRGRPRKAPA